MPHKQRVEFICNEFEDPSLHYLIHLHVLHNKATEPIAFNIFNRVEYSREKCRSISLKRVDLFKVHKTHKEFYYENTPSMFSSALIGVNFGHCAFRKAAFRSNPFEPMCPTGQDYRFYISAINGRKNCKLINVPLLYYINTRSTQQEREA